MPDHQTWKNPVFTPPTCAPIPSIPLDFTPCDHTHIFTASTAQRIGKLTKAGLQDAQVIAQVDKKYILLRMHGLASPSRTEPELLVILDQHAADERVRVERLFRELCTNATEDIKTPLSFVVSARDRGLLKRYEKEWERWGVRYTVLDEQRTVTVVALPAVARDRCESPADRGIVVEMLRRGVYEFEERGTTTMAETDEDDTGGGWVHLLSRIPTALVEMINSRACRGAVMFNDPLTIKECRELVKRLGRCRWPFMCAHGRVSMRPLVELGSEADSRGGGLERKVGFREAFGNWEKRKANTQVVVELD